jgi:uncharacterized protein YbjT (DUF2867 family)
MFLANAAIRSPTIKIKSIAVVGAAGYVGHRLVDHLTLGGYRVAAVGRVLDRLPTGPEVDPRVVDVSNADAAAVALCDIDAAYYLVHAMAGGQGYADRDRATARSFAIAAQRVGLGRIVYLGGLGGEHLSEHLSSRHEVGDILRSSGVPVVELRAAVIIGSGSISFEMLRYLTERLPAMVCPRWVDTCLQPLAERDLLEYLKQALDVAEGTYEIGSPQVTTYHDMMQGYAEVRGLRRRSIVKIPLLTPSLSARWVDLVTPVDQAVSHALIESLTNEVIVRDGTRTSAAFDVRPIGVTDAIRMALSDQGARMPSHLFDLDEGLSDGIYIMRTEVDVPSERIAALRLDLTRCGGDLRWYGPRWPWRLRIVLGRLFAEDLRLQIPEQFQVGSVADWWTIERLDADCLVLGTTAWYFGDAWLGYRVMPNPPSTTAGHVPSQLRLEQVAAFRPRGVPGFVYWRLLRPIHRWVFRLMVTHRVRRAGECFL